MNTLGDRIKSIRNDNHLTQSEFGKKLGVTQTHISKIEKNSENPSDTILRFISYLFCINYEWLSTGIGEKDLPYNSSEEYNHIKFEKSRLLLENNLRNWGTDASWAYINSVLCLSNILAMYKPNLKQSYEAQIEYYKTIYSIINHVQLIVYHDKEIKEGMKKEDMLKIILNQISIIGKIEDDLKILITTIFKINNMDFPLSESD